MKTMTQSEKAAAFLALHSGEEPLVLPNIWNPVGARVLEAHGHPAVATASVALSNSLGYVDGERISRSTLIDCLARIAQSVDVPLTADIETGFGECIGDLEETIALVLDAGVVGINLEDGMKETGALRPIAIQRQRIAAARRVASQKGVHLLINARIDCFLSGAYPDRSDALDEVATRARAYREAGADCIYPCGPGDEETVRMLRDRIEAPINILGSAGAAPLAVMKAIGVNRVSLGPHVFRSCLQAFTNIVDHLETKGDFTCLDGAMPAGNADRYLRDEPESANG